MPVRPLQAKDLDRNLLHGTDQNSGFIFTFDNESKGLDMKGNSEFGLAFGGWGTLELGIM
jgi:hypothetical protein